MLLSTEIDKQLIQSDNSNLAANFIAIAIRLNKDGVGWHSGIIIAVNGIYKIFHYDDETHFEDIPKSKWYFHKELNLIQPEESNFFDSYCQRIKENSNPKYGFYYDGSYYGKDGKFFSENNKKEYMTCVGFCINIILGFIDSDVYFQYTDWDESTITPEFFRECIKKDLLKHPELNEEQYKKHLRRITPPELTASAYLEEIPIKKVEIDKIIGVVTAVIKAKRIKT